MSLSKSIPNQSASLQVMFCLLFILAFPLPNTAQQQVDLENLGQTLKDAKPLRVGGGLSANTIFYQGNDNQQRQPFTYVLNGNINFNLYNQINLPFSFNLNNLGSTYQYPTLPNRLSVHPNYKWITGHIGDIAMTFSPYTLNGHQFTGIGLDLAPEGPLKYSVMYGRLQRKVEYDSANLYIPAAYHRMGYAAKVRYEKEELYLGMSMLTAKDDPNSLNNPPDSLNIFPKSNVAFSWEAGMKITDRINLTGEYGLSVLTRDIRAPREGSSFPHNLLGSKTSTESYTAVRFGITYQVAKNTIGGTYERIDPEYNTLGAYYFNNDYENFTVNYSRPFFQDKATLAANWGLQRDNLNEEDDQTSKRMVGAFNLNYSPHKKLSIAISYSNFQTYMNLRSQFEYINAVTPYDNLDTLNFTQVSQNLNTNVSYHFGKNEDRRQNLNINLSFQQAADKQGDYIQQGNLTKFYNLSTAYSLLLVPEAISFNLAWNTTYNYIAGGDQLILGPTLGVNAKVWQKKVTTGLSASYNKSIDDGDREGSVWNLRLNVLYPFLKRHNLSGQMLWQHREMISRPTTQSMTVTAMYAYRF